MLARADRRDSVGTGDGTAYGLAAGDAGMPSLAGSAGQRQAAGSSTNTGIRRSVRCWYSRVGRIRRDGTIPPGRALLAFGLVGDVVAARRTVPDLHVRIRAKVRDPRWVLWRATLGTDGEVAPTVLDAH